MWCEMEEHQIEIMVDEPAYIVRGKYRDMQVCVARLRRTSKRGPLPKVKGKRASEGKVKMRLWQKIPIHTGCAFFAGHYQYVGLRDINVDQRSFAGRSWSAFYLFFVALAVKHVPRAHTFPDIICNVY